MTLDRELHDLLYLHDCVIVPGFGGFLAHYRPARLDEQRRLVHPPSKELSFNRHLVRQDGLLVDSLVRHEGLDFNAAKLQIEKELAGWREELQRKGRLELPRIGTFFTDAEANLQFEPDKRVNYLKDAYGLRPVAAVAVTMPVLKPEVVPVSAAAETADQRAVRLPAYLAAAATVAILVTAATWWAVGNNGSQGGNWGGFELVRASAPSLYVLPDPPSAPAEAPVASAVWKAPENMSGIRLMPIAGPEVPPVAVDLGQTRQQAALDSTYVATPDVRSRYHVIGGCFLEKENADRLIADLQAKGFAASLVDRKGGLYRVAYGSYPVRSMALEALSAVRKEVAPDAWLLVK